MKLKRFNNHVVNFCLFKHPKPNLSKEQVQYICHFNYNLDIIILKDDKRNATVVMNTYEYESKLIDLLSSFSYKPLSKNPINSITNLVTKSIKYSSLDPSVHKHLILHKTKTPNIYGKPKFHKNYIPLRPIVTTIGAPTYSLTHFLTHKIQSFIRKTPSFIKYSYDFIQKLNIFTWMNRTSC